MVNHHVIIVLFTFQEQSKLPCTSKKKSHLPSCRIPTHSYHVVLRRSVFRHSVVSAGLLCSFSSTKCGQIHTMTCPPLHAVFYTFHTHNHLLILCLPSVLPLIWKLLRLRSEKPDLDEDNSSLLTLEFIFFSWLSLGPQ